MYSVDGFMNALRELPKSPFISFDIEEYKNFVEECFQNNTHSLFHVIKDSFGLVEIIKYPTENMIPQPVCDGYPDGYYRLHSPFEESVSGSYCIPAGDVFRLMNRELLKKKVYDHER